MPKQSILLKTPVSMFPLLRIFDGIFDGIIDDLYLKQQKDSAFFFRNLQCHLPLQIFEMKMFLFALKGVIFSRNRKQKWTLILRFTTYSFSIQARWEEQKYCLNRNSCLNRTCLCKLVNLKTTVLMKLIREHEYVLKTHS